MGNNDTKIEYKCSPCTKSSGFTPLMHAVMSNDLILAKNILESDPQQIDIKNDEGWTALHLAAQNSSTDSSIEMVKLLLSFGADVNIQEKDGCTALHLAAKYSTTVSNLETVELLLKAGADVNAQKKNGWTALHMAARYSASDNKLETVELLLKAGADVNILEKKYGWTALHLAARYSTTDSNLETVELLLKAGADVNIKNYDSLTPLDLVIETTKDQDTINLLIEYGANIDSHFNEKQKQMIEILLKKRLKIEREKNYEELMKQYMNIFHQ